MAPSVDAWETLYWSPLLPRSTAPRDRSKSVDGGRRGACTQADLTEPDSANKTTFQGSVQRPAFGPLAQAERVSTPTELWYPTQKTTHSKSTGRLNEGFRLKSVSTCSSVSKPRTLAQVSISSWPRKNDRLAVLQNLPFVAGGSFSQELASNLGTYGSTKRANRLSSKHTSIPRAAQYP